MLRCFAFLSLLGVSIFVSALAAPGYMNAEEYKRQRQQLNQEFEENEGDLSETVSEAPEKVAAPQNLIKNAKKVEDVAPVKEADALTPTETPAASAEKKPGIAYLRNLKNAYRCFLQFLRDVYAARFKRDSEVIQCVDAAQGCEENASEKNNEKVLTLQQRFKICIDEP